MGLSQKWAKLDIALATSVQHRIMSWMAPTSRYQKSEITFILKKLGKKLVSQNFGAFIQVEMALNSIFIPSFMLFTFVSCPQKF